MLSAENYADMAPGGKVLATRSGGHLSRFRGRGMEFDESRVYQPGDDPRNMDWRVTARSGQPHVKLFREEPDTVRTALRRRGEDEAIVEPGPPPTLIHQFALDAGTGASYVASGEPLDKAGAYGIQGWGALMIEAIEGCYFNVMGLPLARLGSLLRQVLGAGAGTTTITSVGLAVAQNIWHTSGIIFNALSTLIGKNPSARKMMKE